MNDLIILFVLSLILFASTIILISNNINTILIMVFSIFALTSAIFALMGVKFLAIIYLIIYTGAIVVLFVIAAKTTNQNKTNQLSIKKIPQILIGVLFSILVFLMIIKNKNNTEIFTKIDYKYFTDLLFNKNFLLIEIISLILVVSIIGAINFLKKEN